MRPGTVFTAITLSKKKIKVFSIKRYVRIYGIETFCDTGRNIEQI